ncbi:MAG: hypothetical protein ACRD5R_04040 [Candidatus Acidiferrales bacterium]
MVDHHNAERIVNVHTAGSSTEAMVIRALLESAGIQSPGPVTSDPFPMRDPPEGTHGVEVYVLESQAQAAERLIEDYQKSNDSVEVEDEDDADFPQGAPGPPSGAGDEK